VEKKNVSFVFLYFFPKNKNAKLEPNITHRVDITRPSDQIKSQPK
jgi:hypothetical protein